MLLSQSEEEEDDSPILSPVTKVGPNVYEEQVQPEISLNSVMVLTSPKTIKMIGEIQGGPVIVMIDPGATHNFMSEETIQKLGIPVTLTKTFGVSLGTGEFMQGQGVSTVGSVDSRSENSRGFLTTKIGQLGFDTENLVVVEVGYNEYKLENTNLAFPSTRRNSHIKRGSILGTF